MKKEFGKLYTNVCYQAGDNPVFCYRTGLTVYEETFTAGSLMASGWNSAGYPLNVLTNCSTRLNPGVFAEPQAFNIELDGECEDFGLVFKSYEQEETQHGLHAMVKLYCPSKNAEITVNTLLDGTPVFTRWLEIENLSDKPLSLSRLSVMSGGVECMGNMCKLTRETDLSKYYSLGYMDSAEGCMEGDFSWHDLNPNVTSFGGRFTRSRHRHPMFMLRNNVMGTILTAQMAWSAGYEFSIDYNAHEEQSGTSLSFKMAVAGYKPMFVIGAGEKFTSPEVYIGIVAGGLDDAVNAMNAHTRKSVFVLPGADSRPCYVGSGMGPEHDMLVDTTKNFIDQMAYIGCEIFIIDAGWNCPPYHEGEWWVRAGDWHYDHDRYMNGLEEIRDYAASKGMRLGLWMEGERLGDLTDVYHKHPEWITTHAAGDKSNGFIDFTNPEAAQWVEDEIARVITDYNLGLFRVDYNVSSGELFHMTEKHGRREYSSIRHTQAVYKMYANLKARFPDVVFENCAGGGGRTDIGMVKNFNHSWVSDCQTAPRSLYITNGMTIALPPEHVDRLVAGMGCHAYASLDFQMRNAMFGHVSMNAFSPKVAEMNTEQTEFIRHSLDIYKNFIRSFLPDALIFHHTPDTKEIQRTGFAAMEIASPCGCKGSIGVFTTGNPTGEVYQVYPRGVDVSRTYKVTFDNSRTTATVSGYTLVNEGLRVRIPSALSSELMLYEAVETVK